IIIGQSYRFPPVDVTVADNIVVNSRGILYDEQMKTNAVFAGNIGYGGKLSNAERTNQEIKNVDPLLSVTDGLMKLSDGSPAIDAAVGDYPFVKEDLDGQARSQNDVGADEFATGAVVHKPLTPSDVGPDAE
ncbi:MAG: lyase, partial [Paenibacillaceae bacterium]|nr:lyase [Paenibacillaceae bacterium]